MLMFLTTSMGESMNPTFQGLVPEWHTEGVFQFSKLFHQHIKSPVNMFHWTNPTRDGENNQTQSKDIQRQRVVEILHHHLFHLS